MILNIFITLFSIIAFIMICFWSPGAQGLGNSTKILFFHVPTAFISVISFTLSALYSGLYLKKGKSYYCEMYSKAVLFGFISILLTFVSGAVWAKITWGAFWNGDPRQTSIVFLIIIYIAFFALKSSLQDTLSSKKILASYIIFAFIVMPFFVFIFPRMFEHSLHPQTIINSEHKVKMDHRILITLLTSIIFFTTVYIKLFFTKNKKNEN